MHHSHVDGPEGTRANRRPLALPDAEIVFFPCPMTIDSTTWSRVFIDWSMSARLNIAPIDQPTAPSMRSTGMRLATVAVSP